MKPGYGFIKEIDAKTNFEKIIDHIRKDYQIDELHFLKQVHGDDILIDSSGTGDGIILTRPGTGAVIRTADCFSVVLFDRKKKMAGIFHSGWRGTELGITLKGAKILRQMGCADIDAAVFPGIEKCCFEIGPELIERFGKAGIPVLIKGDKYFADIKISIVNGLISEGIKNINDFSVCTFCSKEYFSYRRNKTEKRHASFIINFS